jgi:hypothetical protein
MVERRSSRRVWRGLLGVVCLVMELTDRDLILAAGSSCGSLTSSTTNGAPPSTRSR